MFTREATATQTLHIEASDGYLVINSGWYRNEADRDAWAAHFPKSVKFRLQTSIGDAMFQAGVSINLDPNRINGGRNETGIKRYRTIIKAAEKAGMEISFSQQASWMMTREDFEATIA